MRKQEECAKEKRIKNGQNYYEWLQRTYGTGDFPLVAEDKETEIVAGIDLADKGIHAYPVFTEISACDVGRCDD